MEVTQDLSLRGGRGEGCNIPVRAPGAPRQGRSPAGRKDDVWRLNRSQTFRISGNDRDVRRRVEHCLQPGFGSGELLRALRDAPPEGVELFGPRNQHIDDQAAELETRFDLDFFSARSILPEGIHAKQKPALLSR